MSEKNIRPERKAVYYIGIAITALGFIMFISVFISSALHFGDFGNFDARVKSMGLRGIIGIILIIIGGIFSAVGRMGLSGSGIKLDPQQARKDVEPWSRMSGGIIKDALDEAGIKFDAPDGADDLPFDEKLRRLAKLREEGIITGEEFEYLRKKILENV
ncbi:MAG: SHOCT domain-containing protein [Verrucomicrobiae bacterium]|nr:SHOCT domain-containing protein [Verrucomicrobiae bacterium]